MTGGIGCIRCAMYMIVLLSTLAGCDEGHKGGHPGGNVNGKQFMFMRMRGGGSVDAGKGAACSSCGGDVVELTVAKEGPNKGRIFLKCRSQKGAKCNTFFQWANTLQAVQQGSGGKNHAANFNAAKPANGRPTVPMPPTSASGETTRVWRVPQPNGRVVLRDSATGQETVSPHGVCLEVPTPSDPVQNEVEADTSDQTTPGDRMGTSTISVSPYPHKTPTSWNNAAPAPSKPGAESLAFSHPSVARQSVGFRSGNNVPIELDPDGVAWASSFIENITTGYDSGRRPEMRMGGPSSAMSLTNSRKHMEPFKSPRPFQPNDQSPSRPKRPRVNTGPILHGCGSSGDYEDVKMERTVDDCAKSNVLVSGSFWRFKRCGVSCTAGVALACVDRAEVELLDSDVGGIGPGNLAAYNGVVAMNQSSWMLQICIVKYTMNIGALVHVGASEGNATNSTFQHNLIAIGLDNSASLTVSCCNIKDNAHCAIWVGNHASDAEVVLKDNKVTGQLWIGNKQSLKSILEAGNTILDEEQFGSDRDAIDAHHLESSRQRQRGDQNDFVKGQEGEVHRQGETFSSAVGLEHGEDLIESLLSQASASGVSQFRQDAPSVKRRLYLGTPTRQTTTPAGTPDYQQATTSSA